jgi:hypothetical protein
MVMDIHELKELKIGDVVKNTITKTEYKIIMKLQYSVNCFLGLGTDGHKRINEANMENFKLIKKQLQ